MNDPTEVVVSSNLEARDYVDESLRREIMGPDPRGSALDIESSVIFGSWDEAEGPWWCLRTGEEILTRDPPLRRYGVGMLFSFAPHTQSDDEESVLESLPGLQGDLSSGDDAEPATPTFTKKIGEELQSASTLSNSGDNDLINANSGRPSAMAISCLVGSLHDAKILARFSGAVYRPFGVKINGSTQTWWVRVPIHLDARLRATDRRPGRHRLEVESSSWPQGDEPIEPFAVVRESENGRTLVTFGVVNRTSRKMFDGLSDFAFENAGAIFQSQLSVDVTGNDGSPLIHPYTEVRSATSLGDKDDEDESIELLYRHYRSFGVGHGCAADWSASEGDALSGSVTGTQLPTFEVPTITTAIVDDLGEIPVAHMADLAGIGDSARGYEALRELLSRYARWIDQIEFKSQLLETAHQSAAARHIGECRAALERMHEGLKFLEESPQARLAFELANRAVLLQQLRAGRSERLISLDPHSGTFSFSEPYQIVDPALPGERGRWRPFQIAFLLASIAPTVNLDHAERELVDLIFFPTGGGKTEAYLGLSAFAIFYRRLTNPLNTGTEVLMRYTLRLLTTQQFQRAAALVCAMESIRRERTDLGDTPFRIGIWVGGDSTPNSREQAIKALNQLHRESRAPNKFVILKCPWCSAQMGPLETASGSPAGSSTRRGRGKKSSEHRVTAGYVRYGNTIVLECPDAACPFHQWQLPIVAIDEDLYEQRPDIVIGTVDKFAMLAWDSRPRAIFGIGAAGDRIASPPGLIIQDELHLISGPLGTIAGLFEGVIEELASDRRDGSTPKRPRIVSSTATIRNYEDQVRSLFARERAAIFPPRGIDISDSFFARFDREEDGSLSPGRRYVGVLWQGLGSTQTSMVRSFTSMLQSPVDLGDPELQDAWWTPLIFFGSLRELGGALSLFQSDILDYLKTVKRRSGRTWEAMRRLREPLELTGRMASDQVPDALRRLEVAVGSQRMPVDVCLATNIIEVGVDIDRLSLMSIVGQPKTTAQYIQVSGRVGRRPWERPGLIVTIFSASRPRDRSHFEKFRTFHERMYGQVEPTSVTPFSPPSLERALHAAMVAYVRNVGNQEVVRSPNPPPIEALDSFREFMRRRVEIADPQEVDNFDYLLRKRCEEWQKWGKIHWSTSDATDAPESALLRVAGQRFSRDIERNSWSTAMSMRSVDAECALAVRYLDTETDEGGFS